MDGYLVGRGRGWGVSGGPVAVAVRAPATYGAVTYAYVSIAVRPVRQGPRWGSHPEVRDPSEGLTTMGRSDSAVRMCQDLPDESAARSRTREQSRQPKPPAEVHDRWPHRHPGPRRGPGK
ncbi:hypothetical protein GCM10022227_39920 [Streptomyces sedi]